MEGENIGGGLPVQEDSPLQRQEIMSQWGRMPSLVEKAAKAMDDMLNPACEKDHMPIENLQIEQDQKGSHSKLPTNSIHADHASAALDCTTPNSIEANGLGCEEDDSATVSLATSSVSGLGNRGAPRLSHDSVRMDSGAGGSTGPDYKEIAGPESPEDNSSSAATDQRFLQDLANKFLESKKFTTKDNWTMKDVLASGHLAGLDVEFRSRIGDPQGSGTFGLIMDDGKIRCDCNDCLQNPPAVGFTGTRWEEHFGGKSQRPFLHIFFKHIDLSLKEFWNQWCAKNDNSSSKPKSSKSKRISTATPQVRRTNGVRCTECNGGGTQLVCESCDNLFHLRCMGMQQMPVGNWFCQDCVSNGRDTLYSEVSLRNRSEKRKLLMNSMDGGNSTAKRHKPLEGDITREGQLRTYTPECIRELMEVAEGCTYVLRDLDYVSGSCALCGSPDYEEVISKDLDPRTIIICDTCECEYHIGCLRNKRMADLKEIPEDDWFCSSRCRRVNGVLLSSVKNGEAWSGKKLSYCILRGRLVTPDNVRRIRKVEQIITSCFDPVVDAVTKENLLPMIVRGQRRSNSWDFSGFHSLLLKVNRVWVAAAVFKVYRDTAEVPFVATDPEYRGRGFSLKIMRVLEKVVKKAGIETMLLPSAEATVDFWMKPQFGFRRASKDYTQGNRFLQFPGTVWMEKLLCKNRTDA